MSERWKYQVKTGLFWGFFMTLFNSLTKIQEVSIAQQLSSQGFYIRFLVFTLGGIFVLGYFLWKEKIKQQNKS